jgi:hypothetical protein
MAKEERRKLIEEQERREREATLKYTSNEERDEIDAMCEAMPDLNRLDRYERRAWSRRKRAFRSFIEIKFKRSEG